MIRHCLPYPHPVLKTPATTVDAITPEIRAIWASVNRNGWIMEAPPLMQPVNQ